MCELCDVSLVEKCDCGCGEGVKGDGDAAPLFIITPREVLVVSGHSGGSSSSISSSSSSSGGGVTGGDAGDGGGAGYGFCLRCCHTVILRSGWWRRAWVWGW